MKTNGKLKAAAENVSEEKLLQVVKEYADMNPVYRNTPHFQEQLYLMLKWGYSKKLIEKFLESELKVQDVDFFRLIYLLVKDFNFIKEHFMDQEFIYEVAVDQALDHMLNKKYPVLNEIEFLRLEKEKIRQQYEAQQAFIRKEFDFESKMKEMQMLHQKELSELQTSMERKQFDEQNRKMERMQIMLRNEKQEADKRNQILLKENETLKEENARLSERLKLFTKSVSEKQEANSKRTKEMQASSTPEETRESKRFWRIKLRKRKTEERSEDDRYHFIVGLLKKQKFQTKQYKIILFALKNGLPLEGIKELANPELTYDNMVFLCNILFLKHGMNLEYSEEKNCQEEQEVNLLNWSEPVTEDPPVEIQFDDEFDDEEE